MALSIVRHTFRYASGGLARGVLVSVEPRGGGAPVSQATTDSVGLGVFHLEPGEYDFTVGSYRVPFDVVSLPSVSIGTVETLAPGTPAEATMTGDPPSRVLNLGIPSGHPGEEGPEGGRGDKGDKGDMGDKGDKGDQGDKGDKGDQGDQGDPGPQGAAGADGVDAAGWEFDASKGFTVDPSTGYPTTDHLAIEGQLEDSTPVSVPTWEGFVEQVSGVLFVPGMDAPEPVGPAGAKLSDVAIGSYALAIGIADEIYSHKADHDNPHAVTKAQVGLDKVQNIPSPMTPRWHPGQWYGVFGGAPTGRVMANPNQSQTVASPVWVPEVVTVDQISLEISTAGTAGQTFSLAIYDNDPTTDLPKNLLVATGNILGDTTGHKTESITPTVLQPGWNWLAYTANNGTMQCRGLTGAQPLIASPNPGGYVGGNPRASYVWNYITGGSTTSPPSGPSNRVGLGVYNTAPFIQVRCQP